MKYSHLLIIILLWMNFFFCCAELIAQTPGGIASTNIKIWIKADSGITNVSGVRQWNDLGPAGKHIIQNTANARPVYNTSSNLMNYNPTVKFDGSNDFLSVTPGILGTATYNNMNVFMVRSIPALAYSISFSENCNPYHFSGLHREMGTSIGMRDIMWFRIVNPLLGEVPQIFHSSIH